MRRRAEPFLSDALRARALPIKLLSTGVAAATFGYINPIANLGGFDGPYAIGFLTEVPGTYVAGVLFLVASAIIIRRDPGLPACALSNLRRVLRESAAFPRVSAQLGFSVPKQSLQTSC